MLTIAAVAAAQAMNPYLLPIGPQRSVEVRVNQVVDTRTGRLGTLDNIVRAAEGKRFVYIGETHDNFDAHRWQALIIGALNSAGRHVIVGLEMYQRHKQPYLDMWTLGRLSEEEFLGRSDWANQWGFDFALYRPIFEYAQLHRMRMVALNIPRDWTRAIARGEDLPEGTDIPQLYLGNELHRMVFDSLTHAHPGANMDNMYKAQVLWDEAMAESALRYLDRTSVTGNTVFVILAGNGHVMYGQGINYRIQRRIGMDGVTIVTIPSSQVGPTWVRPSIADFVIGTRQPRQDRE